MTRIVEFLAPEVCLNMRRTLNWTLVLTVAAALFGLSAVERVYSSQEHGVVGETHASHGSAKPSEKKSHATESDASNDHARGDCPYDH